MSAEQIALLSRVNAQINAIPYEELGADQAEDNWVDAPAPGQVWECRDYTIAKAKALREAGYPVGNMSVVLCWIEPEPPPGDPGGAPVRQYHAVLACLADEGLFILDNRATDIYLWSKPPYDYLWAHQQIGGTLTWLDASGGLV